MSYEYEAQLWRKMLEPLVAAMTEYFAIQIRVTWVNAQDKYNKPGCEGGGTSDVRD